MEQFVHQQTIAIFRRLLSTQTDSDEAPQGCSTLYGESMKQQEKTI